MKGLNHLLLIGSIRSLLCGCILRLCSPSNVGRRCLRAGLLLALLLSLTACVAPKAIVHGTGKMPDYRKVYVVPVQNDMRKVHPRIVSRLKQSGFDVIEVKEDSAVGSQGSGFVVSKEGHLLTCAHVVQSETNVTAWIDGARHLGKVIATDTNLDLALVAMEPNPAGYSAISFSAQTNYEMGEEVYTIGFPLTEVLGTQPRLSKGLISSTVGMADSPSQLQVSAEVQPGNSGGPLLNRQGQVVGMMSATLNPINVLIRTGGNLPQNVNFAIKNGPVQNFLATNKIGIDCATEQGSENKFERTKRSVALLRPGIVEDKDLKQAALLCRYTYVSLWDMWFRFRVFHIEFYDMTKGEWVLRAGQYGDNPFSSEDGVLDRTFEEICGKFFPDRPNPFKGKQAKPVPEPNKQSG